jgi:putative serine protease PepD
VIAIALVAGGFALARATNDSSSPRSAGVNPTSLRPASTSPTVVNGGAEPVAAVASAVAPSVVQLETRAGLGSGVVYDDKGLILTAAHVVEDASTVTVRTASGSAVSGKVVGTSPEFDVAVVQVDASKLPADSLPAATLATGVPLVVGQLAVAIGSPFGLDQTVTSGIVSAIDRPVDTLQGAVGMIQTDAPINPGNSGGALADRGGRIIGINDAIQSASGGNEGVGFAIPIDIAKSVADQLVAGKPVQYGFLGVQFSSSAPTSGGAVIADVVSGSPADKSGLQSGDRVVAIDGHMVQTPTDAVARIRSAQPGDTLTITVARGGHNVDIQVTLAASGGK